jgi:predicted nucleic acid-binding protein
VTPAGASSFLTLTDAGPLIALIDADEQDHERCKSALKTIRLPMLTTWPAFTEAMYLLGRAGGWRGQEALWQLVRREDLLIATPSPAAIERTARLMERYSDRPMDLADATLVALAEERGLTRIFTLDDDFHIYRITGRRRFEVVPG